jgi:hypothetical protein
LTAIIPGGNGEVVVMVSGVDVALAFDWPHAAGISPKKTAAIL